MDPSRWLLTWHQPVAAEGPGLTAFESAASTVAGAPVRRIASVSGLQLAVTIACVGESACAAAQARLRADPRVIALVPDARRRAVTP